MLLYMKWAYLCISLITVTLGDQVYDMMYRHIDNKYFSSCIRRFNGTHQVGCSTHFYGNIGKLIGIKKKGDLQNLLKMETKDQIMVFFYDTSFYNLTALELINESSLSVNGIFIYNNFNATEDYYYSAESQCPSSSSEMYKGDNAYGDCRKTKWNPKGNDLLNKDLEIPVTLLFNKTDADFLYDHCFISINKNAEEEKTCKVEIKSIMFGAVNTQTCIRRSTSFIDQNDDYCIPLGGLNVHDFLFPPQNVTENSLLLIMTHMDSRSMFSSLSPGGHSALTGVVPLLLVAKAMAEIRNRFQGNRNIIAKRNVLFSFLNGESFDYIGSGRMVYDMQNGQFPTSELFSRIKLSDIRSIVELNQLSSKDIYVHSDGRANLTDPAIKERQEKLWSSFTTGQSKSTTWHAHTKGDPLPPSSSQSFLKHSNIPTVVITDHQKEYVNRYYNSHLDGQDLNDLELLTNTITDVAYKVLSYVISEIYGDVQFDKETLISTNKTKELLHCFLVNSSCSLLNDTLDGSVNIADTVKAGQSSVLQSFVGTMYADASEADRMSNIVPLTYIVKRLLANYTGQRSNSTSTLKECIKQSSADYTYVWFQGSLIDGKRTPFCSKSLTNYSVALSPAFEIKDYKWNSGEFSTWSESFEGMHSIRIFVNVSSYTEMLYLLISFPYFMIFSAVVVFFYRKSEIIFNDKSTNDQEIQENTSQPVST